MHVFQGEGPVQTPGLGHVNKANCNLIFSHTVPTKMNQND